MAVTNATVAPRYAKALFEVAAEQSVQEATYSELEQLQQVIDQNPELLPALAGKDLHQAQKHQLLTLLTQDASPLVKSLIEAVEANGRLGGLAEILSAYKDRYNEAMGIVAATATTATPLSDPQVQALRQAIAKRLGAKDVRLDQQVDPSVIGGVLVQADDKIIDGTVATRLTKLHKQLLTN